MNKIKDFGNFSSTIIDIVEEIKDPIAKTECSNFLVEKIKFLGNGNIQEQIMEFDLDSLKNEMYSKWGKHIPSYIKSQRDKKLENLGI